MKVNTDKLKEMLSKSIQGAGNNKLIPITQLLGIVSKDGELKLITTDITNYLYVTDKIEDKSELNVTVPVEQFSRLIFKMSCKEVSLEIKKGVLEIVGNGTYTIELPFDENGDLIVYPDPYAEYCTTKKKLSFKNTISVSDINTVLESIKPSIATTLDFPEITNYYVGNRVCATNRDAVASFDVDLLKKVTLISPQLMDLIGVIAEDKIHYYATDEVLIFKSSSAIIYSKQLQDTGKYPIEALEKFIDQDFGSICKVDKNEFIALLERIELFVGKYDNLAIKLHFSKDGITVYNRSKKSNEFIPYTESVEFYDDYECLIHIKMLLTQLKAYKRESVEIHYNNDTCIKFVDDKLVQIIALMNEDTE